MANGFKLDEKDLCFSCKAVEKYSDLAGRYVSGMSEAFAEPMQTIFMSFVMLWAVVSGLMITMGDKPPQSLIKDFFFIVVAFGLMQSQGTELIANVYNISLTLMADVARTSFSLGRDAADIDGAGFSGLLKTGEAGIRGVFAVSYETFDSGGTLDWKTYVLPLLLIIPYFMVVVVFFSKIVVAIFRLMMAGTFSPFLIMCLAFQWGRPMAIAGMKTVLSTIAILFAASAAFGLLLFGISGYDAEGLARDRMSFWESDVLVFIALGWMGVALMTEGVGLANSITGTALSNTAAGLLTAGISGTAAMATRQTRRVAGLVGSRGMAARESMMERMTGGSGAVGTPQTRAEGVARPFVPSSGAP